MRVRSRTARRTARPGCAGRPAPARAICCRRFAPPPERVCAPATCRSRRLRHSAPACSTDSRSSAACASTTSSGWWARASGSARCLRCCARSKRRVGRWWSPRASRRRCSTGVCRTSARASPRVRCWRCGRWMKPSSTPRSSCGRGCAGSSCRRKPGSGCGGVTRATCAASMSCSIRSMSRPRRATPPHRAVHPRRAALGAALLSATASAATRFPSAWASVFSSALSAPGALAVRATCEAP